MRIPSPLVSTRSRARIEIVPLIDIIFFLLATFVMVSLSMVKNQGVTVNLPSAVSSVPQDRKSIATISITEEGNLYLDKEIVSSNFLIERLRTLKAADPELTVFINGDERAYLGKAIEILDQVRLLGITKIAVQTKSKK